MLRMMTVVTAALFAVGVGSNAASATPKKPAGPSEFAREALVNLLAMSHVVVEESEDYSFDSGSCIYAGFVKATKYVTITKTLSKGKSYLFVGGGDDGVEDIDIEVLQDGEVIAADTMEDNTPFVAFTPEATGTYVVKVTLVDQEVDSFVGLACLSTNGWSIPVERLDSAIDSLLERVDVVSEEHGGVFLEAANSWCIYGGVVDAKTKRFSISNIKLEKPPYLIVGAADDEGIDIDLELVKGGEVVAEDKEDDNVPVIPVSEGGTYQVNLINEGDASLTMFTILDLKD